MILCPWLNVQFLLPHLSTIFLDLFVRFCTSIYVISYVLKFIILFVLCSLFFYLCFIESDWWKIDQLCLWWPCREGFIEESTKNNIFVKERNCIAHIMFKNLWASYCLPQLNNLNESGNFRIEANDTHWVSISFHVKELRLLIVVVVYLRLINSNIH